MPDRSEGMDWPPPPATIPKCYCHRCLKERDERINGIPYAMSRMVVCPECGDKRCPHAQDHRNECTPRHIVRRPTEVDLLNARIAELEGALGISQARIKVLEMQAPGYAELERGRIIALLLDETSPYALCLPTSEDGEWEPVMEPEIRAALAPKP